MHVSAGVDVEKGAGAEAHLDLTLLEAPEAEHGGRLVGHHGRHGNLAPEDVGSRDSKVIACIVDDLGHNVSGYPEKAKRPRGPFKAERIV